MRAPIAARIGRCGKAAITRFAMYYNVPVIDIGVKIDAQGGIVDSVKGRVMNYGYVLNDPVRYKDPYGLSAQDVENIEPVAL